MSNIYDALSKHKQEKAGPRPSRPAPPPAASSESAPLPQIEDIIRGREVEALRQRILLEVGPDTTPILVFTGSVTGEGSSTLALHFAREVSEAEDRSVLLVDGDLSGSPHSLTGVLQGGAGDGAGLTDLLADSADVATAVLQTEQPKLHFLPRGREAGAPLDLIKPDRVRRVLGDLARNYSFVVIDAGASLEAPEAALLAAATDGVVLVVRANRTRREVIQKTVRVLHRANCRLLGVVLNDRRYPIPGFLYRRV